MTTHYKQTQYGFEYGSLHIERTCSDDERGYVYIHLETPKQRIYVYATKTGKMRFFNENSKELFLRYE